MASHEILTQSDRFIMGVRAQIIMLSKDGSDAAKQSNAFIETNFLCFEHKGNRFAIMVYLEDVGYSRAVGRCEQLSDSGQCKIYETRPNACGTYPLSPFNPESIQQVQLDHFERHHGCVSSSEAKPKIIKIYAENKIQDTNYLARFQKAVQDIGGDAEIMKTLATLYFHGKDPMGFNVETLSEANLTGRVMSQPLITAMHVLQTTGAISDEDLLKIAQNQIVLIQKRTRQAKLDKNKNLRDLTKSLEDFIYNYEIFIRNLTTKAKSDSKI